MESLSQIFSPFDDLEIICDDHGIPCVGLCCNFHCNEKTKFLCMKCIKSGETCITKYHHELTTLSEMLYRFFLKEENQYSDILQIEEMDQIIKEFNNDEFNKVISNYKSIQNDKYKKFSIIKNTLLDMIKEIIQLFKDNNISKLNKLIYEIKNQKNLNKEEIDLLFKMQIPPEKITKNKENLIEYVNDKYSKISANTLVNQAKFLYDSNSFIKTTKELNNKILLNEITSLNEDKRKNIESKIDSILKEFENEFDEKLSQLEEEIIPTNASSIYSCSNTSLKLQNDPSELEFKEDICSTAHKTNSIDRVFCAFKSFLGEAIVAWGSNLFNIEFKVIILT